MILIRRAYEGIDPSILAFDLAGRPFIEHLHVQLESVIRMEFRALDAERSIGVQVPDSVAADNAQAVLVVDADVWFSESAITRLLRKLREAQPFKVITHTTDGIDSKPDIMAVYLPAQSASSLRSRLFDAAPLSLAAMARDMAELEELPSYQLDERNVALRLQDPVTQASIEKLIFYERACTLMRAGVRIRDPHAVAIRGELICGTDVHIDINVIVQGKVSLGDGVRVGAHSILIDSTIGPGSVIQPYSMIEAATVSSHVRIGPYARIRPGCVIASSVQIGNFVELKNTIVGAGSRINHLAFIGDATLGDSVTIGAGTITCNHNRIGSVYTTIGEGAYIGSGTQLVAPLSVGAHATIGAGSTITEDAPAWKLTIARSRQITVENWTPLTSEPTE